jgi:mannose-6-phosphate isomerase-like protein (cupin superfamily)
MFHVSSSDSLLNFNQKNMYFILTGTVSIDFGGSTVSIGFGGSTVIKYLSQQEFPPFPSQPKIQSA